MKKTLLFTAFWLVILSCKTKEVSKTETVAEKADSVVNNPWQPAGPDTTIIYRLIVNFYSIGSGSEIDLINAYEDSIGAYSGRIGKTIDYRKTHHGREGETDFCLKLKELTNQQQDEFIALTKKTLATGKYINIYENRTCLH